MSTPLHVKWIVDSGSKLKTSDGKQVEVLMLMHTSEQVTLSNWAKHFREHYCKDSEIDNLRSGLGLTRANYLRTIKFPDGSAFPGPIVRAGDFGEILIADYLEYKLDFIVPRTRYEFKVIRNESAKGIDVIGFKFKNADKKESANDELCTFEVKCALSTQSIDTLSRALEDSRKDFQIRKSEALNAMKQRLKLQSNDLQISVIERFQNQVDHPYKETSGAAAIHSNRVWSDAVVTGAKVNGHPNKNNVVLIAVKGDDLMKLVNNLYEIACNEA